MSRGVLRLVCVSDTHGRHAKVALPPGDVLVHAGDFTVRGTDDEVADFGIWLAAQPFAHKVVVAGNHDWLFQEEPARARELLGDATYLFDSGAEIGGLRFWGSPWQPWFMDWAFNLKRGTALREKWDLIPAGTDVLVTHGPPHEILDDVDGIAGRAFGAVTGLGRHAGCEELRDAVARVRPRVHVFGHIHEGYGRDERDGTVFVNASLCDRRYRPVNAPIVVEIPVNGRGHSS